VAAQVMEDPDSTHGEFNLMVKREEYYSRALDQAMSANLRARPISVPYLHGFNLGLVQILPNTTPRCVRGRRAKPETLACVFEACGGYGSAARTSCAV
jgi:hypothetical protein